MSGSSNRTKRIPWARHPSSTWAAPVVVSVATYPLLPHAHPDGGLGGSVVPMANLQPARRQLVLESVGATSIAHAEHAALASVVTAKRGGEARRRLQVDAAAQRRVRVADRDEGAAAPSLNRHRIDEVAHRPVGRRAVVGAGVEVALHLPAIRGRAPQRA